MSSTTTDFPPCVADLGAMLKPGTAGDDIASLDPFTVASTFKSTGLVMFRGFRMSIAAFKALTERVCSEFMSYEGGASARALVDNDPTVMTVTEPSHNFGIPLHGEMYYTKHRPDILWFYCARPADRDGETTIADGSAVLGMLSPPARKLFENHAIKYVCAYPDGCWQTLFRTADFEAVHRYCTTNDMDVRKESNGTIVTEYRSHAIGRSRFGGKAVFVNNVFAMTRWEALGFGHRVVRLDDGTPLPADIVAELHAVDTAAAHPIAWRPGDVVMVDNTRFLHGRRSFTDLGREIYVRLCGGLRSER